MALAAMCVLIGPPDAAAQDDPARAPSAPATDPAQAAPGPPAVIPRPPEAARADRGGLQQTLPDPATSEEVRSQYGWGLISMIVGGVIVAMAFVSLFIFFMRRSWSTSR